MLTHPLKEAGKEEPRAILGMFDVSARPMVEKDVLTLSMPYSVFLKLLENVSEAFCRRRAGKSPAEDTEIDKPGIGFQNSYLPEIHNRDPEISSG